MEALKIYFEQIMKPYKERLEYEVMDRYYKRATYTVDTFMQSNGRVKPLSEIPPEWLECIDGVEEKWFGKDSCQMTIIYKLPNRDSALQMLYKMVTGYDPNDDGGGMLPADARHRLSNIFTAAMNAAGKPQPKNVTPQKAQITEE